MRVTTLLRKLLCVTRLVVENARFETEGLVIGVRPRRGRRARCGQCGKAGSTYDRQPKRLWKHLPLGEVFIWLEYAPRRVQCARCGVRIEQVPWAAHRSRFTLQLEEMVAYLATTTSRKAVSELLGVNWRSVGAVVERIVSQRMDPERFSKLRRVGIDEFSYRKHHRYLTVVVDHDRGRVIWAAEGRSGQTLHEFFDLIGANVAHALEHVTMDMAAGYIGVVRERAPQAEIIFDRFHVAQLASNAVDEVRRSLVRQLAGTDDASAVKKTRWALLKNPGRLLPSQQLKLAELARINSPLYRAYLLKETLAAALDRKQPWRARKQLDQWMAWASRSKLKPFVRLAKTIRKHRDDIVRYVELRLTNAVVEGINNRIRVIARIAYGFHRPQTMIAWIYLCCSTISLSPPLPYPHKLQ